MSALVVSPDCQRQSAEKSGAREYRAAFEGLEYTYEAGAVCCSVQLGEGYSSHPGHVHGGLIATLFDEVMGHAAYRSSGVPMVTTVLRVRFIQPMRPGLEHRMRVTTEGAEAGCVTVQAELTQDQLVAAATARFRPLDITSSQ